MADNQKMVYPYLGTCDRCGCYNNKGGNENPTYHRIGVGPFNIAFCPSCFEKLYGEIGCALHKTPKVGDTVWVLRIYDDGRWWNWGVFPMTIKEVKPNGYLKPEGNKISIWHIHAEDEYTSVHMNFAEIGKTLFFTEEEAKAGLEQKNKEQKNAVVLPEGHSDVAW